MSQTWKTIRVFISSTFKDMQAERDHLVRYVFPKLREELLTYRIHLIDVDLRWGVTSDQDATGVCREMIDECHPRFLCILGGRYGWVPDGKEMSITADEIHYSVLDREVEKRGHAFFYFRDDETTAKMVEETNGEYREPDGSENSARLEALKQKIKNAGLPVVEYHADWNKDQKRLVALGKFGDQVALNLFESLKGDPELASRFTSDATTQPDEFAEEADQMESFIEERTDRFVVGSRESLMRDMLTFAAADGEPNIFVLTGDPGSGKSALLAKFTRDVASLYPSSFILPHFVGASTGSTDLRRTLRRLCHELARAAENTEHLPLDIKELITHFQKLITETGAKKRIIVVFDALNQFNATDGAHWLNWLPRELPPGVCIVASVIAPEDGQPEHQALAILRNRPGTRIEKLESLTEADTLAIIERSLRRYAKRLSPEQLAALLAKPASRLPLYVLTALEELRTLGTYEAITARIRELPGDARALFGWILTERLARDPGFRDCEGRPCGAALVPQFAACLGVSRHGLSPAELTALLDPGDPLGNVAALLSLLRPYLMRRGELLDFYHGQFREAAGNAHLDTPEKQRAAHQSVATCLQAFADPHRDGQCRDATPHALSELPHHQTHAEAWPDLITTLENIFFLEAKVSHGMTFDLAEDFTAAVDALPPKHAERRRLRLLDEALRRDIHFIARHAKNYPQGLFQCLWNSAWWYDCPEAAEHYIVPEGGLKPPPPWTNPTSQGRNPAGKGPASPDNSTSDSPIALHTLLELWRTHREASQPHFLWLRTLRPPYAHLGAGQLAVLRGPGSWVLSVAFSPDERRVLSGSWDSTVRLWDAVSGEELAALRGHEDHVTSVAFSPDGRLVLSGSWDCTVRLWDAASGRELAVLRAGAGLSADPADDDAASGRELELAVLRKHGRVLSVAFSPNGCRVLSGSRDGTARLWDAASGRELAVLRGHKHSVNSVAFSPDGRRVLSGSADGTARLWDADSGRELAVLRGQESPVTSVAFSPDGCRVLSGSYDKTVRLWDADSGRELAVLRGHESGVLSVAFSPDGCRVLSGSYDKTVRLWDAVSGCELAVRRGHEDWVNSVVFSPDGSRVLSGSRDDTVRLWDADSGEELAALRGHEQDVTCLAFSPDGIRVLSGSSSDGTMRLWDAASGRELAVFLAISPASVEFSPDGLCVLTRSWDHTVRRWDAASGRELAVLRGHEAVVWSVAFSSDGCRMLSGSEDNTVRLWAAESGCELAVMRGHEKSVRSVAFSPDGRRVLSGSQDDTVRLWDAQSGEELAVLRGHEYPVTSVAFSSDGRRVVSRDTTNKTLVWDAESGQRLSATEDEARKGTSQFLSGEWLASKENGETLIRHGPGTEPLARFPEALRDLQTHPSGRILAGGSASHVVLLRLEGE